MPDTSVIIATKDRATVLGDTLESLSRVRGIERTEIILVDNGSTDETRNVAASFACRLRVRYILELRPGVGAARTTGALAAHGSLLIFADDDVYFHPNWFETYEAWCADPTGYQLFGGPVMPTFEGAPPPGWLFRFAPASIRGFGLGNADMEVKETLFLGANFAVRASALSHVGYFHPNLGAGCGASGHEKWLFRQLLDVGARARYLASARVWHRVRPETCTPQYIASLQERAARNLVLTGREPRAKFGYKINGVPARVWYRYLESYLGLWKARAFGSPDEVRFKALARWHRFKGMTSALASLHRNKEDR